MPRVEAGVDRSPLQPRLSRGFCPPGNGDDGPPDGDGEPPPPRLLRCRSPTSPCNSLHVCRMPCAPTSSGPFATLRVGPPTCARSVRTSRSASAFGPAGRESGRQRCAGSGLQRLSLLQVGETVVFFINSSLIYRTAFDAWNQQPRRLRRQPGSERTDPPDELLAVFRKPQPR